MKLYQPLHARLSRFVQTLVWNKEDAKDIISETVMLTFEKLETIRDEDALLAYMFSVASNLSRKKLRRKKFWGLFSDDDVNAKVSAAGSEESLMLYELNQALNKLPIKQREAIIGYEVSGLSMEQIAQLHNMSVEGVKSNIHRARKFLQQQLEWKHPLNNNQKGVWYAG